MKKKSKKKTSRRNGTVPKKKAKKRPRKKPVNKFENAKIAGVRDENLPKIEVANEGKKLDIPENTQVIEIYMEDGVVTGLRSKDEFVYRIIDLDCQDEKGEAPIVGYGYAKDKGNMTIPQYDRQWYTDNIGFT